jgi:hypothetical protein
MTTKINIADPEARRLYNLFGRIITILTHERKTILCAAKQSTTKEIARQ